MVKYPVTVHLQAVSLPVIGFSATTIPTTRRHSQNPLHMFYIDVLKYNVKHLSYLIVLVQYMQRAFYVFDMSLLSYMFCTL